MKIRVLTFLILLALLMPVLSEKPSFNSSQYDNNSHILSGQGLVEDVPYVWQEINGFCSWAAASIMFQSAGVPLDMHTLFAASTAGFSFVSARYADTLVAIPGVLYRQDYNTFLAAQAYGVNLTLYFDLNSPDAELNRATLESDGISVSLLDGEDAALNLMRKTIDRGYPLMISVEPIWLPADDYDYLREMEAYGGGHGVVIVGYNDAMLQATIMDPGVGSFGENFGYPEDGRGNYTTISYWDLFQAWSARDFISITIEPGESSTDPKAILGPHIRDRLLGVPTSYRAFGNAALVGRYGEASFRDLSSFFNNETIATFLSEFDGMAGEQNLKVQILLSIGIGLEAQFTLQYLSYRAALETIALVLDDILLSDFNNAANQAIPSFEAISSNASLIYPGTNYSVYTGLVSRTFIAIAEEFNSTGDIDLALSSHYGELSDISMHLDVISDSWLDAGTALTEYWPNDFLTTYGFILIPVSIGVAVIVISLIYWIKRTPSQ